MDEKARTAKVGRVTANGNGNGNGYRNGNGNGNTTISLIGLANLASIVVVIIMMVGFWWSAADPKARLDKIEINIVDTRKELNEGLNTIRKEIPERYTTQREHIDLQNRLMSEVEVAHRTHDGFLPKVQFEAWRAEHDVYVTAMNSVLKDRLDQLYALYRETQKAFHDLEMREQPSRNGK